MNGGSRGHLGQTRAQNVLVNRAMIVLSGVRPSDNCSASFYPFFLRCCSDTVINFVPSAGSGNCLTLAGRGDYEGASVKVVNGIGVSR